jgi:RNA polymerase sigma-70 factor (ECF subfamily)
MTSSAHWPRRVCSVLHYNRDVNQARVPDQRTSAQPSPQNAQDGDMTTASSRSEDDPLAPLLAAIRRRDPTALAELYTQTADRLYQVIHCLLNHAQDAEDILSELFIRVWNEADCHDPARGPVIAWLIVMARSRALDALRRQQSARFHSAVPAIDHTASASVASADLCVPSPVNVLSYWQADSKVRAALTQLNDAQRQLIYLAFFEGLTHAEIATHMALPLGTVKSHLRRAQHTLEQLLGDEHECRQP